MNYYLNPRNDIAFKKIFGDKRNKDILIHFLNDVLNKTQENRIEEVVLTNPTQLPEIDGAKESILDVLCTDHQGNQYIVEMQVSGRKGFAKRAQYYAAKAYSNQADEGGKYHDLKEVVFLAILDFVMFPENTKYQHVHVILDKEDYSHHLKDFSFTFLELPKFHQTDPKTLTTYVEKWCYFFKYASSPEHMQAFLATLGSENHIISKAYNVLEAHHWSREELLRYERMEKVNRDMQAREDYVADLAEARGI